MNTPQLTCPCKCSRLVCFAFHGEPTFAWWVVWLSVLLALTFAAKKLEAAPSRDSTFARAAAHREHDPGEKTMSINCICCVRNRRTGGDLMCDECRAKTERNRLLQQGPWFVSDNSGSFTGRGWRLSGPDGFEVFADNEMGKAEDEAVRRNALAEIKSTYHPRTVFAGRGGVRGERGQGT